MNNTSVANTSLENATGLSMAVPSKAEGIAWCSALILLSVLIVAGNLLTIVLFARNKTLRKKSLFLVINMAFADLMMGALTVPFTIWYLGADFHLWITSVNIAIRLFLHYRSYRADSSYIKFCGRNIRREIFCHILAV